MAGLVVDIIDISDSDDDTPHQRVRRPRAARKTAAEDTHRAGPSRRPIAGRSKPLAASSSGGSLDNITNDDAKQNKQHTIYPQRQASIPLFLTSDEENAPPRVIDPFQHRVHSPDPYEDVLQDIPEQDPESVYLAQIIEIVPDVDSDHVLAMIKKFLPEKGAEVVETILHALLEDPTYPRTDKKGKRKQVHQSEERDNPEKRVKIDYGASDRKYEGGVFYSDLAINQLMADFPSIPKNHLLRVLTKHRTLYAPTHLALLTEQKTGGVLPYHAMKTARKATTTGKRKAFDDPEFDKEKAWLLDKLQEMNEDDAMRAEDNDECQAGEGIDCGCCFTEYGFEKMIQCPEGHLFCKTCMVQYAETLLGSHDHRIICMDQSGCKIPFSLSELSRFLSPKLMALYERVKQGKEIEMAGLEGLEECPFCEYKCVIENTMERLFRCGNEDLCGAITCRSCKRPDHLPKTCQEVTDDKNLDGRHAVEEAMTRALMRNCPKCNKAFVKDAGCNKMICPNCSTMSCYICRKIIAGYEHFDHTQRGGVIASGSTQKCALWDAVEVRHAQEVNDAAKAAIEEYKREHPDIPDEALNVQLAVAPAPALVPAPFAPPVPAYPHFAFGQPQNFLGGVAQWAHQVNLDLRQPRAQAQPPFPVARVFPPQPPPRAPRAARARRPRQR